MNRAANRTPCRHPGVVRLRAGREDRDPRQASAKTLPLKEFDRAAGTELPATLSWVPAFAGMTAVGGQAAVAHGDNA